MDNKLEMLPLQSGELYLQTTWENGYDIITRSIRLNVGILVLGKKIYHVA